ncbi:MAG: heat-inducible transcriptional repressor HrcA [Parachlamydiales bacterium]|nr:heat-inducible transcriptional repressor HrcA [Candidatus Acheromyda pituitae]
MKPLAQKKPAKDQREKLVLFGLIELFLQTGKPIGSNTLRENGFEALSSATIRNYFAKLEEEGLLKQQHSSGGRTPTPAAYKLYAQSHQDKPLVDEKEKQQLRSSLLKESREVAAYLQQAAEKISEITQCAVFLSSPRFDQDFILDIKLLAIDNHRCLVALITDFGLVHTEILHSEKKLSNFTLKRLESFFSWKMTGLDKPSLDKEEETIANRFYKEAMLRHIVSYTNFSSEDIYKTGFSKLLAYPDFNEASALANGLSLFENGPQLRSILHECCKSDSLSCWIGDDLHPFAPAASACSVIAAPYKINQSTAGAIALLGPNRIPYRHLFGVLQLASDLITESLTRSLYKFKITFRQPKPASVAFQSDFKDQTQCLLLEDKTTQSLFHQREP